MLAYPHLHTIPLVFLDLISSLSAIHPRAGKYGDGTEERYRPHYGYRYGYNDKNKNKYPNSDSRRPDHWKPPPPPPSSTTTTTTTTPTPTPGPTVTISGCQTGSLQRCKSVQEVGFPFTRASLTLTAVLRQIQGLSSALDVVDNVL